MRPLRPGPSGDVPGLAVDPAPGSSRERAGALATAFPARLAPGPAALVLTGPAGIGKTTIFEAVVAAARTAGHRTLVTRAVEAEAQLAFGGLVDLLGEVADEVLPALPPVQQAALEVALQRVAPTGDPPPALALSLAVQGAVRSLAGAGPVLIAVDDLPWLDPATARVLEYAARRVAGLPIGLLAAIRTDRPDGPLPPVVAGFAGPVEQVHVAPMDLDGTSAILRGALGHAFRRPTLAWVHERSGGNPFLALEIGRALDRVGGAGAEPGQLASTIPDELIRGRLAGLPEASRRPLAAAAALARPTLEVLAAADPAAPAGLEAARVAGIVEVAAGAVRFAHPLLASAAYGALGAADRRALHGRLAAVVVDQEERARHLALSLEGPAEAVASALDAAAGSARDRGASEAAADLRVLAVERTPPADVARLCTRLVAAGEDAIQAGDPGRARALLEAHVPALPPGPERADVLRVLADARSSDDWRARRALLEQALDEAGGDPRRRGRIIEAFVQTTGTLAEEQERRVALIREAVALADSQDDPEVKVSAYLTCVFAEQDSGLGVRQDLLDRALALAPAMVHRRILFWPAFAEALVDELRDRQRESRATMLRLHGEAERRGDWDSLPLVALGVAWMDYHLGDWEAARRWVIDAEGAARQNGQPHALAQVLATRSMIETALGTPDPDARWAHGSIEAAAALGVDAWYGWAALGIHALAHGDAARAADALARATEPLLVAGHRGPGGLDRLVERVEAHVLLGDLAEADRLAELYARIAEDAHTGTALAGAGYARGLVAAARGDEAVAMAAFTGALAEADRVGLPPARGRILLAQGEAQRRFRRRGAARGSLAAARDIFRALGALPLLRRAEAELARTGHREAGATLAPTEQQIARLVAEGRSNKEIADALFMSPHTVEAHLTRIYRSLGIRGRPDLVRAVASGLLEGGGAGANEGEG